MEKQAQTDMTPLDGIIAANESWLTDRILFYARRRGYTRYTPTLHEVWRQTVAALSATLLEVLTAGPPDVEIGPDQDDTDDPLTRFGIAEAQNHRERGWNWADS